MTAGPATRKTRSSASIGARTERTSASNETEIRGGGDGGGAGFTASSATAIGTGNPSSSKLRWERNGGVVGLRGLLCEWD